MSSRHFFGRPVALILAAAFALTLTGLSYAGDFPANGTHRQTQQRTPDSATGEVEAELRAVVNDYFDALRDKDWARLDAIEVQRYGESGFSGGGSHGPTLAHNTSLELTRRLLDPYRIQALSFAIDRVELKGRQATVRVRFSMQVREAATGALVIDLDGFERVLHLDNYQSSWKIIREPDADGPSAEQVRKATRAAERQFLFCQANQFGLGRMKDQLKREGVRLLEQGSLEQAFNVFELALEVELHLRERAAVSVEFRLKQREASIAEHRAAGRQKDLASNLLWAGQDHAELKNFEKAEAYFAESIKLLDELGDGEELAEACKETAVIQLEQNKYSQAVSSYERSIDKYMLLAAKQKGEDSYTSSNMDDAVIGVAYLYAAQGKYEQVEEFIHRNSKRLESVGETEDALLLLYVIPLLEMNRGEHIRAAENMEKLLLKIEEAGSRIEDAGEVTAGIRLMLTMLYGQQGKFRAAARHLEKMRTADVKRDEANEAAAWGQLLQLWDRMLYGAQGNAGLIASGMKRTLPEMVNTGLEEFDVPDILVVWGIAQASKPLFSSDAAENRVPPEVFDKALRCLLFSAAAAEKAGNMMQVARAHQMIAGLYSNENRPKEIEHYLKGLSFIEGKTLPYKERYLARQVADNILLNLGGTYETLGRHEDAISAYQQILSHNSFRLYRIYEQGIYLGIAQSYYALKNFGEAIKYAREAERAARRGVDRDTLENAYVLAGHAHLSLGQLQAARHSYQSAIDEVEAARAEISGSEPTAAEFFEDKLTPYHAMINLLLSQEKVGEALSYSERAKSKVLLDVLKNGRKRVAPLMTPEELRQEDELRRRLMLLNRQIIRPQAGGLTEAEVKRLRNQRAEARLDYELFRARMYANHPGPAGRVSYDRAEFTAEDAGRLLSSPDQAALEFMVTKNKTYLFVLTRRDGEGGLQGRAPGTQVEHKVYEIDVAEEELQRLVNGFRVRVSHPAGVVGKRARVLYDLLLGKPLEQLAGMRSLIIIPDGILWDLPFQALMPADDHYLLEDFAVSYAPSLTALGEMRKLSGERVRRNGQMVGRRKAPRARSAFQGPTLLAVGNPAGCEGAKKCGEAHPQTDTFRPLAGTARLAKRLRSLYGPRKSRVYSSADADEATVKSEAQRRQVIHIGTHGVLDNDNPMYSFLLLSTPKRSTHPEAGGTISGTEDGLLEAWELMELNLQAEMIVLSACDTARGRVRNGEGIVGFSWAALIAGSPTVVVGQWKVDEDSTNMIMYDFHKRWLEAGLANPAQVDVAAALQQSALALLEGNQYSHPYYWAGFTLVGVGRRETGTRPPSPEAVGARCHRPSQRNITHSQVWAFDAAVGTFIYPSTNSRNGDRYP